ncbi:MAG: hypothetical protein V1691_03155 [Chloroflexota bacterium]
MRRRHTGTYFDAGADTYSDSDANAYSNPDTDSNPDANGHANVNWWRDTGNTAHPGRPR